LTISIQCCDQIFHSPNYVFWNHRWDYKNLKIIIWIMENLIASLDRARRVLLVVRVERLEHVPRRIKATFT
jgi:hypothetical protein